MFVVVCCLLFVVLESQTHVKARYHAHVQARFFAHVQASVRPVLNMFLRNLPSDNDVYIYILCINIYIYI